MTRLKKIDSTNGSKRYKYYKIALQILHNVENFVQYKHGRRAPVEHLIKQLTIKDAVTFLALALDKLTETTIHNCWKPILDFSKNKTDFIIAGLILPILRMASHWLLCELDAQ